MSMPLVKNILKSKRYNISKIYSVVTLNAISSVVFLVGSLDCCQCFEIQ
jgi:hypothetical protein